ncbi:unnamed protein product [Knipowitschia caucasica]
MSQWEKLRKLAPVYTQQVDGLYDRDDLPMDVRHYLSAWIEKQDWERAATDYGLAIILFQQLLENLDIQHSRFVQEDSFLMQHNIRRYKNIFQKYQEEPCMLAGRIQWFLDEEKKILQSAELAEQVRQLCVEQQAMEMDSVQDLEQKMAAFRNEVQCMEYSIVCLEDQQDEFDFKFKTHRMEAVKDQNEQQTQLRLLQLLVNQLNTCRKNMLRGLDKLLNRAVDLMKTVMQELEQWQRRQQRASIGAPEQVSLDQLEKWFTCVALSLFQVREFLRKLDELSEKVSYENDPLKTQKPLLQTRADKLLCNLLLSSFVVENQPSMPQGKGPLVLKTSSQFSVKVRLLVKFPELNHSMKVEVSMESNSPQTKAYRRFNVLGTKSKVLSMNESHSGGFVADFRHLSLKEQKSGGGGKGSNEISLSVTEELHIINFETDFNFKGMSLKMQTSSLPFVVISNSSQQQSAWASVLWFNLLSHDARDVTFFASSPSSPWPQFAEMMSWQFLSATGLGLNQAQTEMIAFRLFGKQQSYDDLNVSWAKFSKENAPLTFWLWFDGILMLVKQYLADLWKDGLIMGFVTKAKEKNLLKRKQRGTFLLRFSESLMGGVTFSWRDTTITGDPEIKTVRPFTKSDLDQIPFHEIIRNFQLMEQDNVPENPLLYLYPNIPKDEAFRKYYSDKSGEQSPYIEYIRTKLMFVTTENSSEASELCAESEQTTIDSSALTLEKFLSDPLLSPPDGADAACAEVLLSPPGGAGADCAEVLQSSVFDSVLLNYDLVSSDFYLPELSHFCSVLQ